MPAAITVHAPATTANLGPGFDTLGLALDLWNETRVSLEGESIVIHTYGEGEGQTLPVEEHLIVRAMRRVYEVCGYPFPQGLHLWTYNRIPWGSGLGSSAAAIVSGLLAANALLGNPLPSTKLLLLAAQLEGHSDNVAPALLGGLTVSMLQDEQVLVRSLPWRPFQVTVVLPEFSLPTQVSRRFLPRKVLLSQAVRNMARAFFVAQAFAEGDLALLRQVMKDELHQPYRLPFIPGAEEALVAAQSLGAAVALSGAGPSLIAFSLPGMPPVAPAMQEAFARAGLQSRTFALQIAPQGASLMRIS